MEIAFIAWWPLCHILHRGPASTGPKTYEYIFKTWLPSSNFLLDSRPYFTKMGEKYKNESPDSEEEVVVPVRWKNDELTVA